MTAGVRVEIPIGMHAGAVPRARAAALAVVRPSAPALADDAALILTELVTNALLHGRPPAVLRLLPAVGGIRIEVEDGGRELPQRGGYVPEASTGRGLGLVAALARSWGVERSARGHGKVVWAELGGPGDAVAAAGMDVDALLAGRAGDEHEHAVTVHLGEVPTTLLLQAKAHVDNLARELTLAAAGAASRPSEAIPAHLASMVEGVVHRFAAARLAMKRQALDAAASGAATIDLVLTLPASAADAGEEYLVALDEADAYAGAARLLTLATPSEHRAFRRWYVGSLVAQLRARPAAAPVRPPTAMRDSPGAAPPARGWESGGPPGDDLALPSTGG